MQTGQCPHCQGLNTSRLPGLSQETSADYSDCTHLWAVSKDDPVMPPVHVTFRTTAAMTSSSGKPILRIVKALRRV